MKEKLNTGSYLENPKQLIIDVAKENEQTGSSTFLIASIGKDNKLNVSFIGDSSMVVIREKSEDEKNEYSPLDKLNDISTEYKNDSEEELTKKISNIILKENYYIQKGSTNFKYVYCSQPQEHSFNFPVQIGTHGDDPSQAKEDVVDIREGDLIILASDGLFDNFYKYMLLDTIEEIQNRNIKNIGNIIGRKAYDLSLKQNYISPFSINANISIGRLYLGGKSDDITISLGYTQLKID